MKGEFLFGVDVACPLLFMTTGLGALGVYLSFQRPDGLIFCLQRSLQMGLLCRPLLTSIKRCQFQLQLCCAVDFHLQLERSVSDFSPWAWSSGSRVGKGYKVQHADAGTSCWEAHLQMNPLLHGNMVARQHPCNNKQHFCFRSAPNSSSVYNCLITSCSILCITSY